MDFNKSLDRYRAIIDARLAALFDEKIAEAPDFIGFSYARLKEFVLRGGKRLRPALTIMAFKAVSDRPEEEIYSPAVGIELFHNSSLIHDDIMDEDSRRRGKLSMHARFERFFLKAHPDREGDGRMFRKMSERFGVSIAILMGDILYAMTEGCLVDSPFGAGRIRGAVEVLHRAYRSISEGQMLDILSELDRGLTEDDILRLIELKTARLFAAALQIGAILGGAPAGTRNALARYALDLGTAFQLQDDLLDISPGGKGRTYGSDLRRGKSTLLTMSALEAASPGQGRILRAALGDGRADRRTIDAAVGVLRDTGAVDRVKALASRKLRDGRAHLRSAALSPEAREFFDGLIDFMARRRMP
jgi:geranylgeranyl diphosphate synthase type I